jgi:hypothetical protein
MTKRFLWLAIWMGTYELAYQLDLSVTYLYWGFGQRNLTVVEWIRIALLVAIPAFVMPVRSDRPSKLLLYAHFYILYVPIMLIAPRITKPELPSGDVIALQLLLTLGITMECAYFRCPLSRSLGARLNVPTITLKSMEPIVWMMAFVSLVILTIVYKNSFHFGDMDSMYEVRREMADISRNTLAWVPYLMTGILGGLIPVMFTGARIHKSKLRLLVVASICIVMYGFQGSKAALFSFIYTYALVEASLRWFNKLEVVIARVLSGLLLSVVAFAVFFKSEFSNMVDFVVSFRIFGVPQILVVQYFAFFKVSAGTHFGHVKPFSFFMHNPYPEGIGIAVGNWLGGHYTNNANASAWAGDGLASFGPFGIMFGSALVIIVFAAYDLCSLYKDKRIATAFLSGSVVNFLEVNVSVMLLSGGVLFLMLLLILLKTPESVQLRLARKNPRFRRVPPLAPAYIQMAEPDLVLGGKNADRQR